VPADIIISFHTWMTNLILRVHIVEEKYGHFSGIRNEVIKKENLLYLLHVIVCAYMRQMFLLHDLSPSQRSSYTYMRIISKLFFDSAVHTKLLPLGSGNTHYISICIQFLPLHVFIALRFETVPRSDTETLHPFFT